ncbi:MAG: hypothetical protein GXP10_07105 [Gammaproteobacteria bacterium]|nr:hypothetical protein [Gammaproteobacteria bacterium]
MHGLFRYLLVFLCLIPCASASQGAIDRIAVERNTASLDIVMFFNFPLQHISHLPYRSGNTLHVSLRPILIGDNTSIAVEEIPWTPRKGVPLTSVRMERSSPDNYDLIMHFDREVNFNIKMEDNYRSMRISLEKISSEEKSPLSSTHTEPSPRTQGAVYSINLESSLVQFDHIEAPPDIDLFKRNRLYTTQFIKDGETWYRLRLGFFNSYKEAESAKKYLLKRYPRAWTTAVQPSEQQESVTTAMTDRQPVTLPDKEKQAATDSNNGIDSATWEISRDLGLMEQARQAMALEQYAKAIRIYTKILRDPNSADYQDALEYLGVARERKRQLAHAKALYTKYLKKYPEGEGAERVRQRLAALITATKPDREKLREAKHPSGGLVKWETYGAFSQFYRRDTDRSSAGGTNLRQSSITSDLDVTARLRSQSYDVRSRFSGGYQYDFSQAGQQNNRRISSLYIDLMTMQRKLTSRFGRQRLSSAGVQGRFDGLTLGYRSSDRFKWNLVAGYPVLRTTNTYIETERQFYGFNVDIATIANDWDFNLFYIDQSVAGITDRQAVGGEARYFKQNRSLLGLVDYDISYGQLNTLLLLGNWFFSNKANINVTLDHRKSPLLTTSNALQGQGLESIDQLLKQSTESEVRQLAEDRSADSRTYTLGGSYPLNLAYQLSGNLSVTQRSATPTSGGVEGTDKTSGDYDLLLQLIGSNIIKEGDLIIYGVRFSNTETADTTTLSANARYPLGSRWRINPRLRLVYRDFSSDGTQQWITAPSLRIDYRSSRYLRFEADIGSELSSRELNGTSSEKSESYYIYMGYRADF